jgi:hypothetical protein
MRRWFHSFRQTPLADVLSASVTAGQTNAASPLSLEAFRKILRTIDARVIHGKGNDRHSPYGSLETDDIWRVCEAAGAGFPLGQALKKIYEFQNTGDIHELLDAVAYLVFAAMWLSTVGGAAGGPLPSGHPSEEVPPNAPSDS